jgi:hypothetical protein
MSSLWKESYQELARFLQNHPEISIDNHHMSLPEKIRPEFWQKCEAVGEKYLNENYPKLTAKAATLSQNYIALEEALISRFGLCRAKYPSLMERFLKNPSSFLLVGKQGSYILDLIKGTIDIDEFDKITSDAVETLFQRQCRSGYEIWVMMSLMNLMQVENILEVKMAAYRAVNITSHAPAMVPPPASMSQFTLQHAPSTLVMVTDMIAKVHDRYIGFRPDVKDFRDPKRDAANLTRSREWLPNNPILSMRDGAMLIYIGKQADDVSIVSDKTHIARPDIIVECQWKPGWLDRDSVNEIKKYHGLLKPRLGTYVISYEPVNRLTGEEGIVTTKVARKLSDPIMPVSEGLQIDYSSSLFESNYQYDDIHILNVAFNSAMLTSLAEAMRSYN